MTAELDNIKAAALANPNEAISEMYEALREMAEITIPAIINAHPNSKEVLVNTLAVHQELISTLKNVEDLISDAIVDAKLIPYGGENMDGVGFVQITRAGKKVVYDNDAVSSSIAERLVELSKPMADGDGEIIAEGQTAEQGIRAAVDTMVAMTGAGTAGFNSWRKTPAKTLGVDLASYATEEGGRLKVTITK